MSDIDPALPEFILARVADWEALAQRATPGGWYVDEVGDFGDKGAVLEIARWRGLTNTVNFGEDRATAEHVAAFDPTTVLAWCTVIRNIVALEAKEIVLPEWTPDCGGDWCLSGGANSDESGIGYFANYWPDNTVSVSIYADGEDVFDSGIIRCRSKAACQAYAEEFVRTNLPNVSPVLRALGAIWADHKDYQEVWKP